MHSVRLGLFILLALPLAAEPDRSRKYDHVIDSRSVMIEMANMIEDAARLQAGGEIAAFLVIDSAGRYELKRWDNTELNRKQTFSGRIPPRTVAIVHTHPNEWSRPSANDRREARRIALPIFVVTRWDIWVAETDGSTLALIRNRDWRDDLTETMPVSMNTNISGE